MSKVLKNILIAIFSCYLLICGLIWIISPWVSSHYLTPLFAEQNLTLAEKSTIRYNPFITKLSISELELSQLNDTLHTPLLSLDLAEIELSLLPLLSKIVHVSQLNIDGLKLNIDKTEKLVHIGGWPISSTTSETATDEQSPQETENNFTLNIPDINIVNSSLKLDWLNHLHTIDLSKINFNQLSLSPQKQQGNLALSIKLNNSPIKLDAEFGLNNLNGKVEYKLAISELDLANFNHFVFPEVSINSNALLSGLLSLNYKQKIELDKAIIKTQLSNIDLSLTDLLTRIQGTHLAITNQKLSSKKTNIDIENWSNASPKFYLNSNTNYELTGFNAYTEEKNLSLANINKLSIPNIELETLDSKHQITLPKFDIENVNLSDNTKDETPSLARFKSMNIFDIKLSEDGLSINNIDIFGLGIDINKTGESEITGLIKPNIVNDTNSGTENPSHKNTSNQDLNSPKSEGVKKAQTDQFSISLNELKLLDTNQISLVDKSVQPAIVRFFNIEQLDIGPIDNQNPEQLTQLTMNGKSNEYANFKFKAESKPFSTIPYYKLSGLFKEVSLPSISTYIKDALNYEFDSGQLDLDIDVTIKDTDINGETKILLRGVELGAANNPNDETLASSSSIPFNYALGMLKDGDGNVELDIPLKGKTTDPDFSIQGFITLLIKRATMSAAKDYLITTFVPYANIVKVSLIAGDYLLKVRFNDLPYTTGDANIPVEASPFLEQFSALMKEKADTELVVCAYATPQDIGVKDSTNQLNDDQHKQLKALSLARMNTFKQYMVNEQDIESSRLLLCSPKVDKSEGAQARLTFTD